MADQNGQPPGGDAPRDPWAPPEHRPSLAKQGEDGPQGTGGSVHDQATVAGMQDGAPAHGAVPPPPVAPADPGPAYPGPYGYPGAPTGAPGPGPYGATPGYGYPGGPGPGTPAYGSPGPYGAPPSYGAPGGWGVPGWQYAGASNGMGTAALVLGIIGCVFFFWGFGIILGTLALIFGIIGRKKARRGEASNGGVALAGIILGPIAFVLSGAAIGLIVYAVNQSDDFDEQVNDDDPFAASIVLDALPGPDLSRPLVLSR